MPNPAANMRTIDTLREEIDALDEELLALIEKRLDLAASIASAKSADQDEDELLLRPAREASVIARLDAMTRRIPQVSLAAIWRELMAINLQAQRPIEIALHATGHPERMQLMARARFGTIIPVRKSASPQAALERARTGKAIAMIEIGEGDWWTALADDPELVIIDGLLGEGGRGSALAVGRLSRDRLCEDRSYAVLEQSELATRLGRGEAVCPIAVSGEMHLCAIERVAPLARRAA
ncbi:chorismate mutase [Alteriqipengyuania sp. NZ-12B]|uniref:chorismate mutase n=2 Tax=Alteriqipengyuania abyssalis TaxID=2860200 RepID=A0ABS7PCR1_9SPHN|nr:chorismate mutase [Alteriqipengyuania abyssalis]